MSEIIDTSSTHLRHSGDEQVYLKKSSTLDRHWMTYGVFFVLVLLGIILFILFFSMRSFLVHFLPVASVDGIGGLMMILILSIAYMEYLIVFSTQYVLGEEQIEISQMVSPLSERHIICPLDSIREVSIQSVGIFASLFGYITLILRTTSAGDIQLTHLVDGDEVARRIHESRERLVKNKKSL